MALGGGAGFFRIPRGTSDVEDPSKAPVSVPASVPSSPRDEIDGPTLAAAQRGERWARRALVQTYQGRVHALAWRMLATAGRRTLAEDLVQEAFVRIFGALPRFVPGGSARLSTWILTLATRAVIDELRRRRPPMTSLSVVEDDLGGGDRPDRYSEQQSLARALARATATLSPEIRAAFVLRAYHDMELREIAEALDVGVGTVKSRLWRARHALQQHLREVR